MDTGDHYNHHRRTLLPAETALLHGLTAPLDNLQGVALGEDQLPDLTRLAVSALGIVVRTELREVMTADPISTS